MPLYHFHLHECGEVTPDETGLELASLRAARELAVHEARIVMCEEIKLGRLCLDCHIEVADDAGAIVAVVRFKDAVAVSGTVAGDPICH